MRPPELIQIKERVPASHLLREDTVTTHPRKDPLQVQITVTVKERTINYDSIYRAQSTRITTAPSAGKASHIFPKIKAASVEEQLDPPLGREKSVVVSRQENRSSSTPHDRYNLPQEQALAGKIIISAGLVLILTGVILQLFLKKGPALAVCGIVVVLIGLVFL